MSRNKLSSSSRALNYSFVPYPVELADMEYREALPPSQLRILALRRFANPVTGEWITTTREVAHFVGIDRSTAHKALRLLERAQYVHIRHLRSRTVDLLIYFGGFSAPAHRQEGLSPLKWDADFTDDPTTPTHRPSQSSLTSHSNRHSIYASTKGNNSTYPQHYDTPPRNEESENSIRNEEQFSTDGYPQRSHLTPVALFHPDTHDESVVQELARKMGEKYMNSFLTLRRTYGLARLERACGFARDKMENTKYPLKERPGAYVRWLLTNGKC